MFFGVFIITIVYVPILALTGIEGKMFHPMALAVMLCLGGALVLTLTLMPVLCSFVLRGRIREGDNILMRLVKAIYRSVLAWALRWRWFVVITAVGLLALAILVFNRLGAVFVPKLDEGSFTAMVFKTDSMNLDASLEMERKTEKMLLEKLPEVARSSRELARAKSPPIRCRPAPMTCTFFTSRGANGVKSTDAR